MSKCAKCPTRPSFGIYYKKPIHCAKHRQPDEVNVKDKCTYPDCNRAWQGQCDNHKGGIMQLITEDSKADRLLRESVENKKVAEEAESEVIVTLTPIGTGLAVTSHKEPLPAVIPEVEQEPRVSVIPEEESKVVPVNLSPENAILNNPIPDVEHNGKLTIIGSAESNLTDGSMFGVREVEYGGNHSKTRSELLMEDVRAEITPIDYKVQLLTEEIKMLKTQVTGIPALIRDALNIAMAGGDGLKGVFHVQILCDSKAVAGIYSPSTHPMINQIHAEVPKMAISAIDNYMKGLGFLLVRRTTGDWKPYYKNNVALKDELITDSIYRRLT